MTPLFIQIKMLGKRKLLADLAETKLALRGVKEETRLVGNQMKVVEKRTFAANQALFTMRRLAYGLTLGFIGLGLIVAKMGFDFNKSVNQAQIGFKGFITGTKAINDEVQQIYFLAAKTPFQFPDILLATQRLIPYNKNLQEVNGTVDAISNSLAAQGVATGQYLTRATIQFAHIYALGRVTGQQVNALARDNIPLTAMLAQHYHTTTAAIQDMIHKGLIPASAATASLIEFQKNPGYLNKNFLVATQTFSGAWATVKDIIRFAVGRRESGIFERLRKGFQDIAVHMLPLIKAGKPISVTAIAEAFDKELTPSTHAIINLFEILRGILTGMIVTFYAFFKVLDILLYPFNKLAGATQATRILMYGLGLTIGVATAAFILYKIVLVPVTIAQLIAAAATWALNTALRTEGLTIIEIITLMTTMELVTVGFIAAALLLVGVLVVLYFRWKRFHDIVNKTARFLYDHWYILALIPIFGPAIAAITVIIRNWNHLYNAMLKVYNLAIRIKNAAFGAPGKKHWWQKSGRELLGLQHGGVVNSTGAFVVGEAGPEIVHLPRGAAVTPNVAMAGGGAFALTIEPAPIIIDGRRIAEVVFKHRLDVRARS